MSPCIIKMLQKISEEMQFVSIQQVFVGLGKVGGSPVETDLTSHCLSLTGNLHFYILLRMIGCVVSYYL